MHGPMNVKFNYEMSFVYVSMTQRKWGSPRCNLGHYVDICLDRLK